MNRNDFLKKLGFGALAVAIAPRVVANKEITDDVALVSFRFNDIFNVWPQNDRLVYFNPSHQVYRAIKKSVYDRIVSEKQFRAYLPEHRCLIPIKEEYLMSDFDGLIMYLDNIYNNKYLYCEYHQGVFLRLIKEDGKDRMHVDLFLATEKYL